MSGIKFEIIGEPGERPTPTPEVIAGAGEIARQWADEIDEHNAALTGGEAVPVESTVMQHKGD